MKNKFVHYFDKNYKLYIINFFVYYERNDRVNYYYYYHIIFEIC